MTTWTHEDVSTLESRCSANGATKAQTEALMRLLATLGVRSLTEYISSWSDDELLAHMIAAEGAVAQTRRRGDLIQIRETRRHPWRTSTSQPMGGAVG